MRQTFYLWFPSFTQWHFRPLFFFFFFFTAATGALYNYFSPEVTNLSRLCVFPLCFFQASNGRNWTVGDLTRIEAFCMRATWKPPCCLKRDFWEESCSESELQHEDILIGLGIRLLGISRLVGSLENLAASFYDNLNQSPASETGRGDTSSKWDLNCIINVKGFWRETSNVVKVAQIAGIHALPLQICCSRCWSHLN